MEKYGHLLLYSLMFGFILHVLSCKNTATSSSDYEAQAVFITQTFNAEFTGTYVHAGPDTLENKKCLDSLSAWRAIVTCEGSSNILGNMTGYFDFCGDAEGHYGNMYAYMLDQSYDTLFISLTKGQVIQGKTEGHEPHVSSYWKDKFEIIGGSGRFAGARGEGVTDDYNSSEDNNSHHRWSGSITMKKTDS